MNYYFRFGSFYDYNAGSKAVNDTYKILDQIGYVPITIVYDGKRNFLYKFCKALKTMIRTSIQLIHTKKDAIFLLQWPQYFRFNRWIVNSLLLFLDKKYYLLIHDIDRLRYDTDEKRHTAVENYMFRHAARLIVHSEPMRDYLLDLGIQKDKLRILTTFDYLVEKRNLMKRSNGKTIVFAGNLAKSEFLEHIGSLPALHFNLYGKGNSVSHPNITYKGCFDPANLSQIEGSWGLVWDGNSIDACEGLIGNYLRYNAPHKLSLYIAAELPVIVWSQSAFANYVRDKRLGIVVNSLKEIESVIHSISAEEYDDIMSHVVEESSLLRNGEHLRHVL